MKNAIDRILEETKKDYPNHLASVTIMLLRNIIKNAKMANDLNAKNLVEANLNEALYTIEKYREKR